MAALISMRFDKHILPYKTNYLIGAPLRRRAVRVTVIFFFIFFLAKGREGHEGYQEGWTSLRAVAAQEGLSFASALPYAPYLTVNCRFLSSISSL